MHIALDNLVFMVRYRQAHLQTITLSNWKLLFFSPKGSELHIPCIIRTNTCATTMKKLPCDYLLHCFYSSCILVWEVIDQNISIVSVKHLRHIDWPMWRVEGIQNKSSLYHIQVKDNGFECMHIKDFHTPFNLVNSTAPAGVITKYSTKCPKSVIPVCPFTGKGSAWMSLLNEWPPSSSSTKVAPAPAWAATLLWEMFKISLMQ